MSIRQLWFNFVKESEGLWKKLCKAQLVIIARLEKEALFKHILADSACLLLHVQL